MENDPGGLNDVTVDVLLYTLCTSETIIAGDREVPVFLRNPEAVTMELAPEYLALCRGYESKFLTCVPEEAYCVHTVEELRRVYFRMYVKRGWKEQVCGFHPTQAMEIEFRECFGRIFFRTCQVK